MIYTITDGRLTAQIDSHGAQLISLRDAEGLEYIWQREAPYWSDSAPILFPIVGRAKDGVISVDGQNYPMSECHGFAPLMDYEAVTSSESSVTFRITDNDYTREKYPFSFAFEVAFSFVDASLRTELRAENCNARVMPFGIGGHPGIRCPLLPGEDFTDYELDFGRPVTLDTTCVGDDFTISSTLKRRVITDSQTLPLQRELFLPDALIFEEPPFDEVVLRSVKSGKGVRFAFRPFTTFAMWTEPLPDKADFLCLEPWNGMGVRSGEGTELAEKKGTVLLDAGDTFSCYFQIAPLS